MAGNDIQEGLLTKNMEYMIMKTEIKKRHKKKLALCKREFRLDVSHGPESDLKKSHIQSDNEQPDTSDHEVVVFTDPVIVRFLELEDSPP